MTNKMLKKLLATLLLCFLCSGCGHRSLPAWPPGTVLVSMNNDESLNTSPGVWNHLSIYVGHGRIVESQRDQGGVVVTPLRTYLSRDYTFRPLYPRDPATGERAAEAAQKLVGLPYRELSSLLRVDRREAKGLNCVSVVRVAYVTATDRDLPHLKIPDAIFDYTELFWWPQTYYVRGRPQTAA